MSLDMLKAGWCTVLFLVFLQAKVATQTTKGGNTAELYRKGTADKSRMLVQVHPDVSELAYRYGRVHHKVNHAAFKQKLVRRSDAETKLIEMDLVTLK